jgi:hypothetical protein
MVTAIKSVACLPSLLPSATFGLTIAATAAAVEKARLTTISQHVREVLAGIYGDILSAATPLHPSRHARDSTRHSPAPACA